MVKIYGESGASFSSMGAYVSLEDYESLKAALRTALDEWRSDVVSIENHELYDCLKRFLDDK